MPMVGRAMRRRSVVGAAVAVSAVSGARKNRAEREYIENANDANVQAAAQQQAATAPAPVATTDPTVELQKYAQLHEQGIINDDEFAAKKRELLRI